MVVAVAIVVMACLLYLARRNKAEGRHAYYINEQYEEALAMTMNARNVVWS